MSTDASRTDRVIEARGLSKHYGEREALVEFDLEVPRGVCYGLLGPNGSGKTTFLKLVSGLFRPSAGTLSVEGLEMPKEAIRVRRHLGILLDQPLVPHHLPLAQALDYVGDLYGGNIPKGRALELLERVVFKVNKVKREVRI